VIDERQNYIGYGDGMKDVNMILSIIAPMHAPEVSMVDLYKGVMPPKDRPSANNSI